MNYKDKYSPKIYPIMCDKQQFSLVYSVKNVLYKPILILVILEHYNNAFHL